MATAKKKMPKAAGGKAKSGATRAGKAKKFKKVELHTVGGKYPYHSKAERAKWEAAGYAIPKYVSRAAAGARAGNSGAAGDLAKYSRRAKKERMGRGALAGAPRVGLTYKSILATSKAEAERKAVNRLEDRQDAADFVKKASDVRVVGDNQYEVSFRKKAKRGSLSGTPKPKSRKRKGAAKRDPNFKLSAAQKRELSPEMQKGLLKYHKGK